MILVGYAGVVRFVGFGGFGAFGDFGFGFWNLVECLFGLWVVVIL